MNYRQWVVDAIPCKRPHAGGQYSVLSTRYSAKSAESWILTAGCWTILATATNFD